MVGFAAHNAVLEMLMSDKL